MILLPSFRGVRCDINRRRPCLLFRFVMLLIYSCTRFYDNGQTKNAQRRAGFLPCNTYCTTRRMCQVYGEISIVATIGYKSVSNSVCKYLKRQNINPDRIRYERKTTMLIVSVVTSKRNVVSLLYTHIRIIYTSI